MELWVRDGLRAGCGRVRPLDENGEGGAALAGEWLRYRGVSRYHAGSKKGKTGEKRGR